MLVTDTSHMNEVIKLSNDFSALAKEKQQKLPYHLNVIDELRANENAHSRILIKLLGYAENGCYTFLQSFLKSLGPDFEQIVINKPVFTAEKDRIDALVTERGVYALIVENKVHGAVDQYDQIGRYFDKMKKEGFPENQIFVLYLTKSGGSPSDTSMSTDLKVRLGNRYNEINYKDNILPWLEYDALPSCRFKDSMLISAIQQYIDHLKGLFQQGIINKEMNEELIQYLSRELGITNNNDLFEQLSIVNQKKDAIYKVVHYVEDIHNSIFSNILNKWEMDIRTEFNTHEYVSNINEPKTKDYFFTGIKLKYIGVEFACAIGIEDSKDQPYFGLTIRKMYGGTKN